MDDCEESWICHQKVACPKGQKSQWKEKEGTEEKLKVWRMHKLMISQS